MFWYFGAKHRTAHRYQPPRHDLIIEPFAGAAGYACYWLEKGAATSAVLYDTDPRVAALWRRILDSTPDEILSWPLLVEGERTNELWLASLAGPGSVTQSNPVVTPRMVMYQETVRRRIAWLRGAIGKKITFVEDDWSAAPDVEATWFIDPPYQHQGHRYEVGTNGIDFDILGKWSQSRQGQVIVCEAAPADWLPFRQFYQQRSLMDSYNIELVWESDPTPTLFD